MRKADPNNLWLRTRIGLILLEQREPQKALPEFEGVLASHPDDLMTRFYLALTLYRIRATRSNPLSYWIKSEKRIPPMLIFFIRLAQLYEKLEQSVHTLPLLERARHRILAILGSIFPSASSIWSKTLSGSDRSAEASSGAGPDQRSLLFQFRSRVRAAGRL